MLEANNVRAKSSDGLSHRDRYLRISNQGHGFPRDIRKARLGHPVRQLAPPIHVESANLQELRDCFPDPEVDGHGSFWINGLFVQAQPQEICILDQNPAARTYDLDDVRNGSIVITDMADDEARVRQVE